MENQRQESFQNILKKLRTERRLLLREVAAWLQIDPSLMSRIESGSKRATREQVIRLASFFKIHERELMIPYLSDKILYDLKDEDLAMEAMSVAESKMKYLRASEDHEAIL